MFKSRSRKGAWIEIEKRLSDRGRVKGRSRKGAWIEIGTRKTAALKLLASLPQGSVD